MSESGILVSVIIPTYERPNLLSKCLQALQKQSFPHHCFEIIIVEDKAESRIQSIVDGFRESCVKPDLFYLQQETQGPATARNRGAKIARGQILLFTDDDCEPDREWVSYIWKFLSDKREYAAVGGSVKPANQNNSLQKFFTFRTPLAEPMKQKDEIVFLITANAAFRKSVFDACCGFDERFRWPGGEDPDLGFRMRKQGHKLGYEKRAIVYHNYTSSLLKHLQSSFNYGRGKYRFAMNHAPHTTWKSEPTRMFPFRIKEHARTLKAFIHARQNTGEALVFWIFHFCTNCAELAGKIYESAKSP